jgi:NDP-sugar pyrophosphorylase family protein
LFDASRRLTGWRNNQSGEERIALNNEAPEALAFSGISVFSSSFFDSTRLQGRFSLVDAFLELAISHQILGHRHEGDKWLDVGKPESLVKAEVLFSD